MARVGDGAGRRLRSGGGGDALSGGAGFLLGAALALAYMLWVHDAGTLAAPGTIGVLAPGPNSTAAAAASARASKAGGAAADAANCPPANLTSSTDFTCVVMEAAKAAADAIDALMDVDALPHLFLSYGNAAYFIFVHNWAASVQQIGAHYVIGSFDDAMLDLCANHSLPCVRAQFATSDDFRTNFAAFRAMGAVKAQLALEILERHPRLPLLVVSDSDTVWLRQPWDYFAQRPTADFYISTDCNSIEMEEAWLPRGRKPACGHIPGNFGFAFNTGLFAVRNTNVSRVLMRDWVRWLTDPAMEKDALGRGVEDQLALNLLFDSDGTLETQGAKAVGPDEPRLTAVYNSTMRLQTLPVVIFAGGHVAFVQRTIAKRGVEPIVIHMTYQRWWSDGKRARLREFGLWHIDPPEYYGAAPGQRARFLKYDNGVVPFVNRLAAQRYPGAKPMPLFYKMWLAMTYQLAAFRDALAAARMLGRVVVLPTLWCWCDYDEAPGILETCINPSADYEMPFRCPLDFMLDMEIVDWQQLEYRNPNFLDLPQVPASVRNSRAVVDVAPARPDQPFPPADRLVGHAATVWPGITQPELVRVLAPLEEVAVLEFRGEVPGFLGGWSDAEAAAQFDEQWAHSMSEARWCCTTWGPHDEQYRTINYAYPRPFGEGAWQPWEAPPMRPPEWCDLVSNEGGNRGFTRLPQHPCYFLREPPG